MKKGIIFIGTVLCIVLGYLYVFPIYPDYNIDDDYFDSLHSDKDFSSPNNGIHIWAETLKYLEKNKDIIGEFNSYSKCYVEDNCSPLLINGSEIGKEEKLQVLLQDTKKMNEFRKIMQRFLNDFSKVSQSDFISYIDSKNVESHNYSNTLLFSLSRGTVFYGKYISQKEYVNFFEKFYEYGILSYNKTDAEILTYLSYLSFFNIHLKYIENNISNFSSLEKNIILMTIEKSKIQDGMIENSIKVEHQFGEMAYADLFTGSHNRLDYLKLLFLYDHKETLNLMDKIDYHRTKGQCDNIIQIKLNGRNWIGRTLLQGIVCSDFGYKVEKKLNDTVVRIIKLLSN